MDLKLNGEEGDMSTFVLNGEWALLGKLTCWTFEHSLGRTVPQFGHCQHGLLENRLMQI